MKNTNHTIVKELNSLPRGRKEILLAKVLDKALSNSACPTAFCSGHSIRTHLTA